MGVTTSKTYCVILSIQVKLTDLVHLPVSLSMCHFMPSVYVPSRHQGARIAFSLRQKMVDSALSRSSTTHYRNPVWGQEKGERNASLLMAAPGLEEGRDRGRGGFNEGNGRGGGEGEGEGEADSLAPQLFGKTHRLLWKTQDVGMQAGRTGLAIPPNPTPNRPHTRNSILSIPLLTLSCLSPLLPKEPVC